jgi:hypothetical protein
MTVCVRVSSWRTYATLCKTKNITGVEATSENTIEELRIVCVTERYHFIFERQSICPSRLGKGSIDREPKGSFRIGMNQSSLTNVLSCSRREPKSVLYYSFEDASEACDSLNELVCSSMICKAATSVFKVHFVGMLI